MSVSNPVGSGGGFVSFDQDLQGMAEQMNTVGGWAEIMAQDSLNNTVEEEESRDDSNDRTFHVQERDFPDSRIPQEGSISVQVANVPRTCDPDDLFCFLGGEEKIVDIDVKADLGRATVVFRNHEAVQGLIEDSKALKLKFMDANLKVYVLQNRAREQKVNRERDSYYPPREPYSKQSSRYNSQSSISSDIRHDNHRYDRPDYGRQDRHYGTMPPPSRGGYDIRGGYRGGYRGARGGARGGYNQRGGFYEMQRSESYTHDRDNRDRPGPINRSRTESTQMDRRQSDMQSRTSSQFSLNNDEPRPQIKKPTAKDIFGDAKPVDTADKLLEIEKRMEEKQKQKLEQEKAEKEAARQQQQQQQQQAMMAQSHPPPHHHGQPHYGQQQFARSHHGTHYFMPPTYYQNIPPPAPVFTTPVVQLHQHTHQSQIYQGQEQQMSPRFDGTPGSVKILQRTDAEREAGANMSPPLDPEHTLEPLKEPTSSTPKDTVSNQSMSKESVKSDSSHKGPTKFKGRVITFSNSSHKGYDSNRGGYRGGGRGGRGGRGGGHGGHRNEAVAAESSEHNNNNVAKENAPQDDSRLNKENDSQDHHGSQSSLKHRGHGKPRGRGGPNRGFKDRPPRNREDRGSRDEQPKTDGGHHHHYQKDQKSSSTGKKDEEKSSVGKTPSKSEMKETPAKEPQTPKAQEAEPPSTPTSEANQKKNKKKKNTTKAAVSVMNGNKFAALLNADE